MRIIQFCVAIPLAAALSGCVTGASRQDPRTASVSPGNEYKIIVVPVPIYLSKPDRGDQDQNSGDVVPPRQPGDPVRAQFFELCEPTSPHQNQQQNSAL